MRWTSITLTAALAAPACASVVSYQGGAASSGAGGTGSAVSGTFSAADGAPACQGPALFCFDCVENSVVPPLCPGGTWACPAGTVDDPGQCVPECNIGPPRSCDTKLAAPCSYGCALAEGCVHDGVVCTFCPDTLVHVVVPYTCQCAANSKGGMGCKLMAGCCNGNDPFECGDLIATECVKHRCEPAPSKSGECWQDADCPGGGKCAGQSICPCGSLCDAEDHPGACLKG